MPQPLQADGLRGKLLIARIHAEPREVLHHVEATEPRHQCPVAAGRQALRIGLQIELGRCKVGLLEPLGLELLEGGCQPI